MGLLLTVVMTSYQNCGKKMSFSVITPPSPEAVVCGGFGDGSSGEQKFGIIGNIFISDKANDPGSAYKYPTEATPLTSKAGDLISIYLNNINVPTRDFTEGFVDQTGGSLTDNDGNVLIEYFGLKLRFSLILPDDYEAGYYQIGIESDDGSEIRTLNGNNEMIQLIDNEGTHSTKSKCADKAIYFDHTTRVPSELYYFQGPRTKIALRLVWKKVDNQSPSSTCGDINVADGTADSNYWKIIPSTAYELPSSEQINPCVSH